MTVSQEHASYLFLNAQRVHYLSWNRGQGRRTVLALHGLASNARIWELTAEFLVDRGLELVALDLRGHGLTDKPDGDYGFDTFISDISAFVRALDIQRPVIVGHSWGAMLALEFASRYTIGPYSPAGIVLVDGGAIQLDASPGATWESTRDRLQPPHLAGMPVDDFIQRVKGSNPLWQPGDRAIEIILANFEIDKYETIRPHLSFEHHMQIVRSMWEFQTYAAYARLRCPVLLVPAHPGEVSTQELREFLSLKEKGVRQITETNPDVKVEWMHDSVHDIPLQRPSELAEWIVSFSEANPYQGSFPGIG